VDTDVAPAGMATVTAGADATGTVVVVVAATTGVAGVTGVAAVATAV